MPDINPVRNLEQKSSNIGISSGVKTTEGDFIEVKSSYNNF